MAKHTPRQRGPLFIIDNGLPVGHNYGTGRGFYLDEARDDPKLLEAYGLDPKHVDLEKCRLTISFYERQVREAKELSKEFPSRRSSPAEELAELESLARTQGYWDERERLDPERAARVLPEVERPSPPHGFTSWKEVPGYDVGIEEYRAVKRAPQTNAV